VSCPNCHEAGTEKYRPFCSKRCADVDLARWLNGDYAVPSMREENEEDVIQAMEQALSETSQETSKKPH
jgi:endogenous inhibitor of DNA gyrase (YacG/DUF329 family)